MRAQQSLYEATYSHAAMSGVMPELRPETEIRSRSTQFPSSASSRTDEKQRNSFMNRPKFRKFANDSICSEPP
jgi:hypothetical protein